MGRKRIHSNPKTANAKALWLQTLNPHAGALEIKAREKRGLSKGNTKTHGNSPASASLVMRLETDTTAHS